jgi:hypothetical protein
MLSLLDKATPSSGRLSTNIPQISAEGDFYYHRTFTPPATTKRYPSLSVVPMVNLSVPYRYKKPSAKAAKPNTISEDEPFENIELKAGSEPIFMNIYTIPNEIQPGMFIHIRGLTYSAYRGTKDGKVTITYDIAHVSPSYSFQIPKLLEIPRLQQTIDLESDVNIVGVPFVVDDKKYSFVLVRIKPEGKPVPENDGFDYGRFKIIDPQDPKTFAFAPYSKDGKSPQQGELMGLTGGSSKDGNSVNDIELFIVQNAINNQEEFMVSARTRLYADSIQYFFVGDKWKQLGPVFCRALEGLAIVVIDPTKTHNQNFTPTPEMKGAIGCSTIFLPYLDEIARSVGISCTWDEIMTIGGKEFADPTKLACPSFKHIDLVNATAINLLMISGDITRLKKGFEDGEVEFYVVSNMLELALDTIREDPKKKLPSFTNNKNFTGNSPALAIYAMLKNTNETKERIQDYLRAKPTLHAPIDTLRFSQKKKDVVEEEVVKEPKKKAKIVEEDDDEEEDEEE